MKINRFSLPRTLAAAAVSAIAGFAPLKAKAQAFYAGEDRIEPGYSTFAKDLNVTEGILSSHTTLKGYVDRLVLVNPIPGIKKVSYLITENIDALVAKAKQAEGADLSPITAMITVTPTVCGRTGLEASEVSAITKKIQRQQQAVRNYILQTYHVTSPNMDNVGLNPVWGLADDCATPGMAAAQARTATNVKPVASQSAAVVRARAPQSAAQPNQPSSTIRTTASRSAPAKPPVVKSVTAGNVTPSQSEHAREAAAAAARSSALAAQDAALLAQGITHQNILDGMTAIDRDQQVTRDLAAQDAALLAQGRIDQQLVDNVQAMEVQAATDQANQLAAAQVLQAQQQEKLSFVAEKPNTTPVKSGWLGYILAGLTGLAVGIAGTLGLKKLLGRNPSPSQPTPPRGSRSFFELHHVDPNNATASQTSLVIAGRAVSLVNNAKAAAPVLTVLALPRRPALLAIGYETKTLALPYNPAATENRPAVPTAGTPIVPSEQPVQKPVANILALYAAAKQEIAKHNKAARTDKSLKLDANAQTALRNLVVALQDKAATAVAFDKDAATAFASARYAYNMVFKHYEKERSLGILQTITDNLDAIGAKDAKLGQLAASFAQRKATGKTKEATDIRKTAKAYKAPERNDAAIIELATYQNNNQLAA
jgi:hypothetical protein